MSNHHFIEIITILVVVGLSRILQYVGNDDRVIICETVYLEYESLSHIII
jgi:hypothetical protein